jgi:hypothetical protein
MRFFGGGPDWLRPFALELSDLDLLPDLDPGLLVWDPTVEPVLQ